MKTFFRHAAIPALVIFGTVAYGCMIAGFLIAAAVDAMGES